MNIVIMYVHSSKNEKVMTYMHSHCTIWLVVTENVTTMYVYTCTWYVIHTLPVFIQDHYLTQLCSFRVNTSWLPEPILLPILLFNPLWLALATPWWSDFQDNTFSFASRTMLYKLSNCCITMQRVEQYASPKPSSPCCPPSLFLLLCSLPPLSLPLFLSLPLAPLLPLPFGCLARSDGMLRLFDQVSIICDSVTLGCLMLRGLAETEAWPLWGRGLSTQDWTIARHPASVNEKHPHPPQSPGSLLQEECLASVTHGIAEGY